MSEMPVELRVSVIIPTYNRAHFVVDAVQSVLLQTYSNIEIIVVDDGSTDGTKDALARFDGRIRYVVQDNAGPAAARNTGIRAATGTFVSFLDSDDLFVPETIAEQMSPVPEADEIRFCKMRFESFGNNDTLLRGIFDHGLVWPRTDSEGWLVDPLLELGKGRYLQLNGLVCRRSVFDTVGFFDTHYPAGEDEDWFFRVALKMRIRLKTKELAIRRVHENQTGLHREEGLRSLASVLRIMSDRAVAAGHPEAARQACRRLGDILSALSNVRALKGYHREAAGFAWRAFRSDPTNWPRLLKSGLFVLGWTPRREREH